MKQKLLGALIVMWAGIASAQPPLGSTPPGYGELSSAQAAGAVAGYQLRLFRSFNISIPFVTKLADLQALLPPGYTAIASPAGSDTANAAIGIAFQQRQQIMTAFNGVAPGVYAPNSELNVSATVLNPSGAVELVLLHGERSTQEITDIVNAMFGANSVYRSDEYNFSVGEKDGVFVMAASIRNDTTGFRLKVDVATTQPLVRRTVANPVPITARFVTRTQANTGFRLAQQLESEAIATQMQLKIDTPGNYLKVPGGGLHIVSIPATMSIQRWAENFIKLTPGS